MSSKGNVLSRAAMIIFWLGILASLMTVRVVFESHAELASAQSLQAEGNSASAVDHYRRALRWYAPANPYSRQAGLELLDLATRARESGEEDTARRAFRAVIAGINASRSFYVPYRDLRSRAQAGLTSLRRGEAPREDRQETRQRAVIRPSSFVVVAGFLLWLCSAFAFARRAIAPEGHIVRNEALRWGASFILGVLGFMLGLALN